MTRAERKLVHIIGQLLSGNTQINVVECWFEPPHSYPEMEHSVKPGRYICIPDPDGSILQHLSEDSEIYIIRRKPNDSLKLKLQFDLEPNRGDDALSPSNLGSQPQHGREGGE